MLVHLFLVDLYNDGNYWRIGVAGDLQQVTQKLQSISKDVRYIDSYHKRNRDKFTGKRMIGDMQMMLCEWKFDITNVMGLKPRDMQIQMTREDEEKKKAGELEKWINFKL